MADKKCICGHFRSNHSLREIDGKIPMPCYGCKCQGFKTQAQLRAEKTEARFQVQLATARTALK